MPGQYPGRRIHVVESIDWKDAVIALLEPSSPYRPWRHGDEKARDGEAVAMILNTEPRSVLTLLGRSRPGGDLARVALDTDLWGTNLLDLENFPVMTRHFGRRAEHRSDWLLRDDEAEVLEHEMDEYRYGFDQIGRFGHTSIAAARVLLHSEGNCDGCDQRLDLRGRHARNRVHVRTVGDDALPYDGSDDDENRDWPATLCNECHQGLRNGGFHTFLAYRFSKHPQCPVCTECRTGATFYGMPATQDFPPWTVVEGCSVEQAQWRCLKCNYAW